MDNFGKAMAVVAKYVFLEDKIFTENIRWTRGLKVNRAQIRRWQAEQRAIVIAALGWKPEGKDSYTERYIATTGELIQSLRAA